MSTTLPWIPRTLANAYTPRPPIIYPVAGIFARPSLNIVYGAPGTFKSILMADCAANVATGKHWLDPLPNNPGQGIVTAKTSVLWIDCDNGERRSDDRFEAIGKAYKLDALTPLYYVSMPNPWPDFSQKGFGDALELTLNDWDAHFVVIDNLGLVTGNTDEITAEMAPVMGNLRRLAEHSGSAVTLIHHQRKSNGTTGRKGDTLRGHSSIEAALDLALLVERDDGSATVKLTATKVRGADIDPFGAMFTYSHKPGTKELAEARFYGLPVSNPSSDKAIEATILDTLALQGPMPKTQLIDTVHKTGGYTRQRVEDVLAAMKGQGHVIESSGPKGAKLYQIP